MSGSDSQLSERNILRCESSVAFIQKPPTLRGICSVETGLPVITKPQKPGGRRVCTFEPAKRSLKKNVALPKLKQTESPKRAEAGESYGKFCPFPCAQRSESVIGSEETFVLGSCDRDSSDSEKRSQKQLEITISKGRIEELLKKIDHEEVEENRALKRWEFWMKDKKRIQNYLSKKIGRHPYNLLLQESDKYRKVMEQKILHSHPIIPKLDKFEESNIHQEKTTNKKGKKKKKEVETERPVIECIRIPDGIKAEKGLLPPQPEILNSKLSRKQKGVFDVDFSCGIEKEGLVIIGKPVYEEKVSLKKKEKDIMLLGVDHADLFSVLKRRKRLKYPIGQTESSVSSDRLPEIITPQEEEQKTPNSSIEDRSSIFCLVINGEEIKYEIGAETCQNSDKSFVWELDFGVRAAKSIAEKTMKFENRGTIAVKYDWFSTNFEPKKCFGVLQLKKREPWFFFNKNSGFFLPGQIYEFKFYLHAKSSGIRKETWYLKTNPPLSENQEFGEINISAVATEEFSEVREPLEFYLRKRVKESIVFFIMEVLLRKVFRTAEKLRGLEYRSIFCGRQLFECLNPKYYYHASVVKQLIEIFEQIPNNPQKEWDMSLETLIYLTKNLKTGIERNDTLKQISELAKRSLKRNHYLVENKKKYKMAYGILCKTVNFIEEDYNYLRSLVSEKPKPNFTPNMAGEEDSIEAAWPEEYGEFEPLLPMLLISPINFVFFQTLLYFKVYHRICEAAEGIAGALETAKLFEPCNGVTQKLEKPAKPPTCQTSNSFFSK